MRQNNTTNYQFLIKKILENSMVKSMLLNGEWKKISINFNISFNFYGILLYLLGSSTLMFFFNRNVYWF